jgi:hypothetical protein
MTTMDHLAKHDHHRHVVGDKNRSWESLHGLHLSNGRGTSVRAGLCEEVNYEKAR